MNLGGINPLRGGQKNLRSEKIPKVERQAAEEKESLNIQDKFEWKPIEGDIWSYIQLAAVPAKYVPVFAEDPSKYLSQTYKLNTLKRNLIQLGKAATIGSSLAFGVIGYMIGGPVGEVVATIIGIPIITGTFEYLDKKSMEIDDKLYSQGIEELKKNLKPLTPEETIKRLRAGKPVWLITSLSPLRKIKLNDLRDAFHKLILASHPTSIPEYAADYF